MDNQLDWLTKRFLYRLTISPDVRLLTIGDTASLDRFHSEYKIAVKYWTFQTELIDWRKVAERYDGIEIAPYIWERRLESRWYHSWDCASGCLWETRGTTVELLEVLP